MLSRVRKFLIMKVLVRNFLTFVIQGEKKVRNFLIVRYFLTVHSQDSLRVSCE
jgi:hypothetical protein